MSSRSPAHETETDSVAARIERLLAVIGPAPVDEDRFVIDISEHVHGHLFGGLVAAQALHAAYTTVGDDRRPHSAHAYFLRRGKPELPIEFEVHRDTDGRSFSARRVAAIQEGRPIFTMVCSFHVPDGTDVVVEPMPEDVPPPSAMPPDAINTLGGSFEIQREVFAGSVPLERRFGPRLWVRAAGPLPDDPMLHDCLLFYATDLGSAWDAAAPAPLRPRTSLDHAIWVHRPTRMDEWHHVDLRPGALADARGHYTGQMWHHDGTHVASIAQENLVRAD